MQSNGKIFWASFLTLIAAGMGFAVRGDVLAEWAEKLHLWLAKRNWARDIQFHRGGRTIFYVFFILLTLVSGYTLFETLSPTGILSRALIYGPGLALVWVLALLAFEVFVSRMLSCS